MPNNTFRPWKDQSIISSLFSDQGQINRLNIPKDFDNFQASSIIGVSLLMLFAIEVLAIVVVAKYLLSFSAFLAFPLVLIMWGGIGNQCIILLHEASHRTLMPGSRSNQNIGFCLASLVGLNYKSFTRFHMLHHKLNGKREDEEFIQLQSIDGMRGMLRYLSSPPMLTSVFPAASNSQTNEGNKEFPLHLLFCGAFHCALIYAQYLHNGNIFLSMLFTFSIPTTAIFCRKMRVLSEHCNTLSKTEPVTRSHQTRWFDSYFFNGFGMNWHVEHHLYPNIPGYRLHKVNAYLSQEQGFDTFKPHVSVFKTLISILRK